MGDPYLPRQSDQSDGPSTLPVPELNPLVNPVLGQNMGRWAEVYFTSPPEKREQAVIELLRELQGENSKPGETIVTSPSSVNEQASERVLAHAAQTATLVRCPLCGRKNPTSHRFCGMCGRPVAEQGAAADLHVSDLHVSDLHLADVHIADVHIDDLPQDESSRLAPRNEPKFVPAQRAVYEPALRTNDLSLFQSRRDDYRDDSSDEIFHYPPASRSYRAYVGIALAIVIFVLGYMAWRSMQATSQNAHVERQAPPAVATQPAAPAPTPPSASKTETPETETEKTDTPKTDTPEGTPSANPQTAVPSLSDSKSEQADARTSIHKAGTSSRKTAKTAPPMTPIAEKEPQLRTAGNGAEELVTAQGYLNGANGQGRNRTEAAKWLWKSVAKHNADATLLLADLYLKGQGVRKNCDQARVLLDAAARKGMKDAGQRLRHLQAFGCE